MQLNIFEPKLNAQLSAKALIELLEGNEEKLALEDSIIHHKLPLYVDSDNSITSTDVMIISKNYGVLIFKCIESSKRSTTLSMNEILIDVEQIYSLIYSKLVKSRALRTKPGELGIQIKPFIYCFGDSCEYKQINDEWDELEVINQDNELFVIFEEIKHDELNENIINEILSILEGSQSIRKQTDRFIEKLGDESKGAILDDIETQIANFDKYQKRAALKIIDGPQRIRGLAGSGKPGVLAMKGARIH